MAKSLKSLRGQPTTRKGLPLDIGEIRKNLILDNDRIRRQPDLQLAGPRTGGGGNSCALVLHQATQKLLNYPENPAGSHSRERLDAAIRSAKFYVSEGSMLIDGETKDAVNFPSTGEIFMSRRFCNQELMEVSGRALAMLLHEYLGLANIDDRTFEISGAFLERYAIVQGETAAIEREIEVEVQKDLRGKASCFGGAVRKMRNDLAESIGGRFNKSYSIYFAPAGSMRYRAPAKYCEAFLDSSMRPTEIESEQVYRQCTADANENFIVTIVFGYATSGSIEEESLVFQFTKKVSTTMIVDAKAAYHPDDSEIHDEKTKTAYECRAMVPAKSKSARL